jgi:hypothetical protein
MIKKITTAIILSLFLLISFACVKVDKQENFKKVENYLHKLAVLGESAIKSFAQKSGATWYAPLGTAYSIEITDNETVDCYFRPNDITDLTIFVSKGLILEAKNEAELIFVLLHELSHMMSKSDDEYDDEYVVRTEQGDIALETAMDRIAILIMAELGYRPSASMEFLERALKGPRKPDLLKPESAIMTRITITKNLATDLELYCYNKNFQYFILLNPNEFEAIKSLLKSGK